VNDRQRPKRIARRARTSRPSAPVTDDKRVFQTRKTVLASRRGALNSWFGRVAIPSV